MVSANRVEKKERARLKTVKFHARTGMIECGRVSVQLQGGGVEVRIRRLLSWKIYGNYSAQVSNVMLSHAVTDSQWRILSR